MHPCILLHSYTPTLLHPLMHPLMHPHSIPGELQFALDTPFYLRPDESERCTGDMVSGVRDALGIW
jgi:hypothetical protein